MEWNQQGCNVCRTAWERAVPTTAMNLLGTSYKLHCRLYQCRSCQSYWEELERFAHEIDQNEAMRLNQDSSFEPATSPRAL